MVAVNRFTGEEKGDCLRREAATLAKDQGRGAGADRGVEAVAVTRRYARCLPWYAGLIPPPPFSGGWAVNRGRLPAFTSTGFS